MAKQNESTSSRREKKTHISEQPVTLANWYRHIDWVNVVFVAVIPFFGLIAAFSTPLLWKTGVWALVYYFMTGLGITAGKHMLIFLVEQYERSDNNNQATTDFGPTPPTRPPSHSNSCSPLSVAAQSKAQSAGGPATTAHTIATRTRSKTPTRSKKGSCIHTWAGWSSNKTRNLSGAST